MGVNENISKNFSTESAKNTTIYDSLFLIAIDYPKSPSPLGNSNHLSNHSTITEVFPDLGAILTGGLKYRLKAKFLRIFPCLQTVLWKVNQAQSNWFVLKEAPAYKRGMRRFAHPDMSMFKWLR